MNTLESQILINDPTDSEKKLPINKKNSSDNNLKFNIENDEFKIITTSKNAEDIGKIHTRNERSMLYKD